MHARQARGGGGGGAGLSLLDEGRIANCHGLLRRKSFVVFPRRTQCAGGLPRIQCGFERFPDKPEATILEMQATVLRDQLAAILTTPKLDVAGIKRSVLAAMDVVNGADEFGPDFWRDC